MGILAITLWRFFSDLRLLCGCDVGVANCNYSQSGRPIN